jgi:hypothetical protein
LFLILIVAAIPGVLAKKRHSPWAIKLLRVPILVDLHADPFERAEDEADDYSHWRIDRIYLLVPAQAFPAKRRQLN